MTRPDVDRLLGDLREGDAVRREAAVARLRILGSRAVDRLASFLTSDIPADARAAALNALEGLDDPRAPELALPSLADPDADVATAAAAVLRGWVARERGTALLDALAAAALDPARPSPVRLAALDALSELPRHLVQPLTQRIPAEGVSAAVVDDPVAAREWLASTPRATLSALHDFVTRARDQERAEPAARRAQDWLVARGAAHAALARRGSRVALYDLRESFDAAPGPLPLDFLTPSARWATPPAWSHWRGPGPRHRTTRGGAIGCAMRRRIS